MKGSQRLMLLLEWTSILITVGQSSDSGEISVFPSSESSFSGTVKKVGKILIDADNRTIYFTAMNRIFSMSTDLKTNIKEVVWNATATSKNNCKKRNKNDKICNNYIPIFDFDFKKDIFACGTNALTPTCTTFNRGALKTPKIMINGYRQHSPRSNEGTVVTLFVDPYLFIGMRERQGAGKLFKLKPYGKEVLATTKGSEIFKDKKPDFISAYTYDNYAYFFLREDGHGHETAKRRLRFSRIARVCKHDAGAPKYRLNKFITLLKTRLQCNQAASSGNDVFYDGIQSTFELKVEEPLSGTTEIFIYAVFSLSHELSISSAICRYRVKDIQTVFALSDLYKRESSGRMVRKLFSSLRSRITRSACNSTTISISTSELMKLGRNQPQLLYDDVLPYDKKSIFSLHGVSFTSIVVDELKDKDGVPTGEVVVFAGSTKGEVFKIFIDRDGKGTVIGTPFQPFKSSKPINSLKKMKNMIYVGGFEGIASFRIDNCDNVPCGTCIRDPYCVWSESPETLCVQANTVTTDERLEDIEKKIKRVCPEDTSTTTTPSTSTEYVKTTRVTTTQEAAPVWTTRSPVTTTRSPVTITSTVTTSQSANVTTTQATIAVDTQAARKPEAKQTYRTEFIIMTILFVVTLTALFALFVYARTFFLKFQSRDREKEEEACMKNNRSTHKFCPSFSKTYMVRKDSSKKELMYSDSKKQCKNPTYKPTIVEKNNVGHDVVRDVHPV